MNEKLRTTLRLPDKNGKFKRVEVPAYVAKTLERVEFRGPYLYSLRAKYPFGKNRGFDTEMNRFINWAKRWGADCRIVEDYNKTRTNLEIKNGRNVPWYLFELTDPVCQQLEKAGFLSDKIKG